jgi:tetratricopeptide (TPR) repeat protein
MIDKNQIDEAFAHCRYILELYPKHIDTYRLMGKALLEAQRFGDASDVFHRVLSSVPDDFIAHLGMSIIREDESNLDAAIWHMERSFEVQPSNAAVQVELRRLYGLRDGVTPQKIQLTRGALARMSAKSNLHSQSIAELRSALSSDPQRPDLQVVLAEMYLQTGSRMEAIETCNALINKLPYCLTANRILAEVLPETERADQAHEYKTRMGELDPYYLQLSAVAPTLEQVPDGAVTIERFEYTGETFETEDSDQPAWAASLGVDLEDEKSLPDEPTPDWIDGEVPEGEAESAIEIEDPVVSEDLEMTSDEGAEEALEDIPDWISDTEEAGEEAAPITESETAFEADEVVEEVEIFPSQADAVQEADEVPDWMREEAEPEEQDDAGSIPGIAAAAGAAALGAAIAGQDEENGETEPDAEPAAEEVFPDEIVAEPLPDWMAAEEPGEVEAGESGSVADILKFKLTFSVVPLEPIVANIGV